MSKKSLPRELLSAYFDDEVSAEERAQVGRAIEQSPAINQVLEDYRQLS
ncbi:MAG: zf-HC2 domain-containing protein [Planctomycetaceae bacterium]|nr:zf-HC2 domain-containing protein [Planctomycetaceae bacterium]